MKKLTVILALLLLVGCQTTRVSSDTEMVVFEQAWTKESVGLEITNLNSGMNNDNAVTIIHAEDIKVEAEINKDLLDHGFRIELVGDEIIITTDNRKQFSNLNLDIVVYAPVDSIEIEGAFVVKYDRPQTRSLDVELDGAGSFELTQIDNERVDIDLDGAGSFELSGKTNELEVNLDGAGSIEAFDLVAERVTVELDGAGSVEVTANSLLDAELSGLGSIVYRGNPQVNKEIDGLGSISADQ